MHRQVIELVLPRCYPEDIINTLTGNLLEEDVQASVESLVTVKE